MKQALLSALLLAVMNVGAVAAQTTPGPGSIATDSS
jgi:hypothetical protein